MVNQVFLFNKEINKFSLFECKIIYLKLFYCTRTVVEIDKTLKELQFIQEQRNKEFEEYKFLAIGLSARRSLCINDDVKNLSKF